MVRFVLSYENRTHVDTRELGRLAWLSVSDRVRFFKCIHIFKIRNKTAPSYLAQNFNPVALAHSHNTRGSAHDYVISDSLARSPSSFAFTAIKEWNGLPTDIKNIKSESVFKARLKEWFFSRY